MICGRLGIVGTVTCGVLRSVGTVTCGAGTLGIFGTLSGGIETDGGFG